MLDAVSDAARSLMSAPLEDRLAPADLKPDFTLLDRLSLPD